MSTPVGVDVLLPCPFCGSPAKRIDFGPGDAENEGGSCIACTLCQSSGPVEFGRKEHFVSNWNRRSLAQQPASVDEAIATASDRDLLKTVASATGLTWRKDIEEERAAKNILGLWITNQDGSLGNTAWNPLHSSSDAFHLAVELGISVCVRGDAAATRRAIVHAALAAQPQGARHD